MSEQVDVSKNGQKKIQKQVKVGDGSGSTQENSKESQDSPGPKENLKALEGGEDSPSPKENLKAQIWKIWINYLEFLDFIWIKKNYRSAMATNTVVTLVVAGIVSIVGPPVKDQAMNFVYWTLGIPTTPLLDDELLMQFLKEYNAVCKGSSFTECFQQQRNGCTEGYPRPQENNLTALNVTVTEVNSTLHSMETNLRKQSKILHETTENITFINATMNEHYTKLNRGLNDQIDRHFGVKQNLEKTLSDYGLYPFSFAILGAGEIILLLIIYKLKLSLEERQRSRINPAQSNGYASQHSGRRPPSILSRVSTKAVEASVCVLSFNGDPAHKKHIQVSKSFITGDATIKDCVINGEEDILGIPLSKVFLVHVDFNARNIILENPDREVGELKRTTVLALWKMEAEVILIYHYDDRDAKPFDDQDIYNHELGSVKTQTELKILVNQRRFLSIQGQLTMKQKQHLNKLVKESIGPQG